jgi:deoxyribonuclease-4
MQKNDRNLLLGAHVSISGGFNLAIERATSLGLNCMQIFVKSNRQWAARPLAQQEIVAYKQTKENSPIKTVVAHATYLVNIGAPSDAVVQKSMSCVKTELERCHQLEIPYLVLHPGAFISGTLQECLERISSNINIILEQTDSKTMLLLENMAGQGTTVGFTFEQLAHLIKNIKRKDRVGVCLDTCHAFAAGYDFTKPMTYEAFLTYIDTLLGVEQIKVIHFNDSKKPLASKVDRHAHIGKGNIGLQAFKLLLNDPRFAHVPKILETPHEEGEEEYVQDLAVIRELIL